MAIHNVYPTDPERAGGPTTGSRAPRWLNMVLGAWLFISAFAWTHSGPSFTNTWIMGLVVAGFALLAMWNEALRWVNTMAGAWLFISAFALPKESAATFWNNLVVGVVVAFVSLMPMFEARAARRGAGRA